MKTVVLMLLLLSTCHAVSAAPRGCSGILHVDRTSLQFGGHSGEGEGICLVAQSQRSKVLKVCSDGRFCRVSGTLGTCEDSGECQEIKRVDNVQKK